MWFNKQLSKNCNKFQADKYLTNFKKLDKKNKNFTQYKIHYFAIKNIKI